MDLVLTVAVLYGWHCIVSLEADEQLVVRWRSRWRVLRGAGRWLAHPLPSGISVSTTSATGLRGRTPDVEAFEERLRSARRSTRPLALWCNAYLAVLLVAAPVGIALLPEERALLLVFGGVVFLHLGGLLLLSRVGRRLGTSRPRDWWERFAICALYPPAFLREPHELVRRATAEFHPVVASAALMDREDFGEELRRTLARLRSPRYCALPASAAAEERAAIVGFARARGVPDEVLGRPRVRLDPCAASYCELCLSDYRTAPIVCSDCGIPTLAYAEGATPSRTGAG